MEKISSLVIANFSIPTLEQKEKSLGHKVDLVLLTNTENYFVVR